jgi:hypothetical protein
MPILLCALLLFTASAHGGETSDRTAIEKVIATWNDIRAGRAHQTLAAVFLPGANRPGPLLHKPQQPWSEVTTPQIVVRSVTFVTPNVARVDAADSQFGTYGFRRVPLSITMVRTTGGWRIASAALVSNVP